MPTGEAPAPLCTRLPLAVKKNGGRTARFLPMVAILLQGSDGQDKLRSADCPTAAVYESLHRDALGEVAWLVDVAAAEDGNVVGQELQWNDRDEWL